MPTCSFLMKKEGEQFIEDSKLQPINFNVRFILLGDYLLFLPISQFEKNEARLASFKDWPAELKMRPEELAEAGFYHDPDEKHADQVELKLKGLSHYDFVLLQRTKLAKGWC